MGKNISNPEFDNSAKLLFKSDDEISIFLICKKVGEFFQPLKEILKNIFQTVGKIAPNGSLKVKKGRKSNIYVLNQNVYWLS